MEKWNLEKRLRHTPGPWEKADFSNHMATVASKETGEIVCDVNMIHKSGSGEANLKLVVAAPDLLETLERLKKELTPVLSYNGSLFKKLRGLIDEAIKRAT